jgi:ATP-dependent helicase/DNAse subunit B
VLEALQERLRFDAAHPVAAHELAQWGGCAFKGLGSMVLGLEGGDQAGEELDPRARGSFWHDALAEVVPELRDAGLLGKDDPSVRPRLEAAVEKVAETLGKKNATGHPSLWKLAREWAVTVLHRVLTRPDAVPFPNAKPKYVEVDFGNPRAPPELQEVKLPASREGELDVYFTGRMDRVDTGPGTVGVLDYKTSISRTLKDDFLQREFQMPLYLLAVRALVPDALPNGVWLGVGKGETRPLAGVLGKASVKDLLATDELSRARAEQEGAPNLANAVHGLLGRLRAGDFGARPMDCEFCELKPVCRISQRQLTEDQL